MLEALLGTVGVLIILLGTSRSWAFTVLGVVLIICALRMSHLDRKELGFVLGSTLLTWFIVGIILATGIYKQTCQGNSTTETCSSSQSIWKTALAGGATFFAVAAFPFALLIASRAHRKRTRT